MMIFFILKTVSDPLLNAHMRAIQASYDNFKADMDAGNIDKATTTDIELGRTLSVKYPQAFALWTKNFNSGVNV